MDKSDHKCLKMNFKTRGYRYEKSKVKIAFNKKKVFYSVLLFNQIHLVNFLLCLVRSNRPFSKNHTSYTQV